MLLFFYSTTTVDISVGVYVNEINENRTFLYDLCIVTVVILIKEFQRWVDR